MVTRLNPSITFDGNAREAMEFYQSVFGGELDVSTWSEMPDTTGPKGSPISVSLSGEDEAELRGWWDKLSDGADITAPFGKAPWGDTFGMCVDRFGVHWMVNVAGDSE